LVSRARTSSLVHLHCLSSPPLSSVVLPTFAVAIRRRWRISSGEVRVRCTLRSASHPWCPPPLNPPPHMLSSSSVLHERILHVSPFQCWNVLYCHRLSSRSLLDVFLSLSFWFSGCSFHLGFSLKLGFFGILGFSSQAKVLWNGFYYWNDFSLLATPTITTAKLNWKITYLGPLLWSYGFLVKDIIIILNKMSPVF